MASKNPPTKGTSTGYYKEETAPRSGETGGEREKVWIPGKQWVKQVTAPSGEHTGSSGWVLEPTKPPSAGGTATGSTSVSPRGPGHPPDETPKKTAPSPASEQMMAMQGALSGALNGVLSSLFPSSTIPLYNQSVNSGLATAQSAMNGTNLGLQALQSNIMASNPTGANAMSKAQNVGNLVSGTNPSQLSSQLGGIVGQEQSTNALFEQHLPGMLQTAGADTLPTAYYTDLANALKYEQIYSAGINPSYVPPALQPFAQGASGTAAATTGAGSLTAGATGTGPGNNQSPNPYTAAGTTPPKTQ